MAIFLIGLIAAIWFLRLSRRNPTAPPSHLTWLGWDRNRFAKPFWQQLLVEGATRLPKRVALFLNVILSWIFLFLLPKQRSGLAANLTRVLGPTNRIGSWLRVRKVFYEWGLTLIEAFAIHVGKPLAVTVRRSGKEHINVPLQEGNGGILVTCHLGSWHVASKAVEDARYPLNIVMRAEANPAVRNYLERIATERKVNFIYVGEDFTTPLQALQALHALRRNELVAIQADRMIGEKGIDVEFFGEKLHLPIGPALLSLLSGAPLIPAVAVRTGKAQYDVTCYGIIRPETNALDRQIELKRLTQEIARHLEKLIRQYPYQWFNFYPLWTT